MRFTMRPLTLPPPFRKTSSASESAGSRRADQDQRFLHRTVSSSPSTMVPRSGRSTARLSSAPGRMPRARMAMRQDPDEPGRRPGTSWAGLFLLPAPARSGGAAARPGGLWLGLPRPLGLVWRSAASVCSSGVARGGRLPSASGLAPVPCSLLLLAGCPLPGVGAFRVRCSSPCSWRCLAVLAPCRSPPAALRSSCPPSSSCTRRPRPACSSSRWGRRGTSRTT